MDIRVPLFSATEVDKLAPAPLVATSPTLVFVSNFFPLAISTFAPSFATKTDVDAASAFVTL